MTPRKLGAGGHVVRQMCKGNVEAVAPTDATSDCYYKTGTILNYLLQPSPSPSPHPSAVPFHPPQPLCPVPNSTGYSPSPTNSASESKSFLDRPPPPISCTDTFPPLVTVLPQISSWLGVVSCLALDRLPNRNACMGIDPTVRGLLPVVSSEDGSCGGKTRSARGPKSLPSTGRSVGMQAQMTAALSSAVDQLATKTRSQVMSCEEGYWLSQMVRRTEIRQTLGRWGWC